MSPDARVLIVDDDRLMRLRTRRMLGLMAITKVVDVENGGLALQLFWHAPSAFDLIICDWNMPLMSGVDVCKQIRAARPTLPFIMVTARLDLMSVRSEERRVGKECR